MAGKKKSFIGFPIVRGKEKLRSTFRDFDLAMLGYLLVVVACVLVGRSGEYELGSANLHGFALCFLLVPAYLILEILGLISFLGGFSWEFTGFEAEFLGICDLFLGLSVWLFIRLRGASKGISYIKAARTFVLIVMFWGVFQLGCSGALWMWQNGGFSSFNRHLVKAVPGAEDLVEVKR